VTDPWIRKYCEHWYGSNYCSSIRESGKTVKVDVSNCWWLIHESGNTVNTDMTVTTVARSVHQESLWTADMRIITIAQSMNQESLRTPDMTVTTVAHSFLLSQGELACRSCITTWISRLLNLLRKNVFGAS